MWGRRVPWAGVREDEASGPAPAGGPAPGSLVLRRVARADRTAFQAGQRPEGECELWRKPRPAGPPRTRGWRAAPEAPARPAIPPSPARVSRSDLTAGQHLGLVSGLRGVAVREKWRRRSDVAESVPYSCVEACINHGHQRIKWTSGLQKRLKAAILPQEGRVGYF